jgi:hypothetical protein
MRGLEMIIPLSLQSLTIFLFIISCFSGVNAGDKFKDDCPSCTKRLLTCKSWQSYVENILNQKNLNEKINIEPKMIDAIKIISSNLRKNKIKECRESIGLDCEFLNEHEFVLVSECPVNSINCEKIENTGLFLQHIRIHSYEIMAHTGGGGSSATKTKKGEKNVKTDACLKIQAECKSVCANKVHQQ